MILHQSQPLCNRRARRVKVVKVNTVDVVNPAMVVVVLRLTYAVTTIISRLSAQSIDVDSKQPKYVKVTQS